MLLRAAPIVVVLAVIAGAFVIVNEPDKLLDDRRGSELVRRRGEVLDPGEAVESYEIVYRSVETATDVPVTTTERIRIRRPFDARVQIFAGEPPGGELRSERLTRLGVLGTPDDSGTWTLFAVPPAVAGSDTRPGPVLADAVDDGLLDVRERRRVLGRECQVYRAGGLASGGNLVPFKPGGREYADVCIDSSGLMLEEIWVQDGRRLTRKVATKVDIGVDLPDSLFDPANAAELSFDEGGGLVNEVDPQSTPSGADFWTLDSPPEGFEHRGRFSVVPARLDPFRNQVEPTEERRGTASVADVWVRGPDLLVIDQGFVTSPAGEIGEHPHAKTVDLGDLGEGEAFYDFRATEVRARGVERGFVRVFGTLSLDELTAIARSLHPVPGTELIFLDE